MCYYYVIISIYQFLQQPKSVLQRMSKELVKERSKEKEGRDRNHLVFKLHLSARKHYTGYSKATSKLKINGPEQTLHFS